LCCPSRDRHPRFIPLPIHELDAELTLCRVLIVWPTAQPNSFNRRAATPSHRLDVIELEEPARLASMTRVGDERALPAVSAPNRAPDVRGDVPSLATRGTTVPTRSISRGEPALLKPGDGQIQDALQDLGEIAARDLMAQKLLRVEKLVVGA